MARDPRAFLWDVRESADAILRFTAARTEREYRQDEMLRAAVERHFEIIGEALNRLTRANPVWRLAFRARGRRLPSVTCLFTAMRRLTMPPSGAPCGTICLVYARQLPSFWANWMMTRTPRRRPQPDRISTRIVPYCA